MKAINLKFQNKFLILNILNEVCNGVLIDEFENKIGVKREVVELLLKRLSLERKTKVKSSSLNDVEVEIIKKSFDEVIKEIEDWEFHPRLGVFLEEAKTLLRQPPLNWKGNGFFV